MRPYLSAAPALFLAATSAAGQAPAVPVPSPTQTLVGTGLNTTACAPSANPEIWGMQGPRVWASGDFMLGWVSRMETPDLIQLVPAAAAALPALPAGAAVRVFPTETKLNFGTFNGYRGAAGVAFDRWGLDASGFAFQRNTESGEFFSTGDPATVARAYVRAQTGEAISFFTSLAGQYAGGVSASADSRVWGADANLRLPTYAFLTSYTQLLGGFRYADVDENLSISSQSTFTNGNRLQIFDQIHTRNQFYGGQVGAVARLGDGPGLGLDLVSKFALGTMKQRVDLTGSNTFLVPGQGPDVQLGGLYARGSNLGSFERDKVATVSETTVNLTYTFPRNVQVSIGYTGLYLSSVVRPGNQIDQIVNDANARFVANPPPSTFDRPTFEFRATDMWIHSLTFGAKVQY